MKHLLALLLILALSFQLSGCLSHPYNTLPSDDTTKESENPSPSPDVNEVISQRPMYSVTFSNIEETHKAEDGTTLLITKHQNISLVLPEQEVADAIILDFLHRMDQAMQPSSSMLSSAKSAYSIMENWSPDLLLNYYSAERIDTGVLSLHGVQRTYQAGAAHSYESGRSVTYDLLTGKILHLPDVLESAVTGNTLLQLVVDSIDNDTDGNMPSLFPTYKDSLKQLFSKDLASLDNWYLSKNGLVFYYNPYEIGPYSSGIIKLEIPYNKLTGIIKDAYFPDEIDTTSGFIHGVYFDNADLNDYTQFSEVILKEGSDKILLYTDGAISDVSICAGPKETLFVNTAKQEDHIFSCYTLTPGDAIMIEADLAETTLLIGYRSGEEYRISTIVADNETITIK